MKMLTIEALHPVSTNTEGLDDVWILSISTSTWVNLEKKKEGENFAKEKSQVNMIIKRYLNEYLSMN